MLFHSLLDDKKDPESYNQWQAKIRKVVGSGTLPVEMGVQHTGQTEKENNVNIPPKSM